MALHPLKWKPVVGFESAYEVSETGIVRGVRRSHMLPTRNGGTTTRTRRPAILSQTLDKDGYAAVHLCYRGKDKVLRVARVVLEAFVHVARPLDEALHLNHDVSDNRVQNLRWGTRQMNEDQKTKAGRRPLATIDTKLDAAKVRRIRRLCAKGFSQTEVAEGLGVSQSTISLVLLGKTWRWVK